MQYTSFHLVLIATAFSSGAAGATFTSCTLFPVSQPAITQTDPSQCYVTAPRVGFAFAQSSFRLAGNSGYGEAIGHLSTTLYAENTPDRNRAEALATFEYGVILITSGPERPGYLRYRFNITQYSTPFGGITTQLGDYVFESPGGSVCTICNGTQLLPVILGKDMRANFTGRGQSRSSVEWGADQDLYLLFSFLEADGTTLVTDLQIVPTPEPGGLLLVAIGLGVALQLRRRSTL